MRFRSGYRQNLKGPLLDYAMKEYTSHRTVPSGVAEELSVEYQKYLKAKAEKKSSSAENSVTEEHPNDITNFSWVHNSINLIRASLIEIRTSQTRQGQFSDHFDYMAKWVSIVPYVVHMYERTYIAQGHIME